MLAGRGLSAVTVEIDPGIFRAVLPLPASTLRVAGPFLVNPRTRGRAITITFDQFTCGWANALDEQEAKELHDTFHVAGSGISLMQMGNANLNPWTEANTKNPDRGPLLIIEGEKDHTVSWGIAHAAYKRQRRNPRRDGDREDPEPRPLPHDRPRLARGRPDGARLRQAVRLSGHCAATTSLRIQRC
jgi:non-heme chloroperoxidase